MQFLMNSTCAEQPVPEKEQPGPQQSIPASQRKDQKSRKGPETTARQQNKKRLNLRNSQMKLCRNRAKAKRGLSAREPDSH